MVDIKSIAHSLANQCRFGGHSKWFYSVAQHSVLAAKHVALPEARLAALLHDAAETYLGDIPRPLKKSPLFREYEVIEANILDTIMRCYGIREIPDAVFDIDNDLLLTEASQLMTPFARTAGLWDFRGANQLDIRINCWSPREAEDQFLNAAFFLGVTT